MARHLSRIGAVIALLVALTGCGYNDFQRLDETTKSAWGEVLNPYQRRADLIESEDRASLVLFLEIAGIGL